MMRATSTSISSVSAAADRSLGGWLWAVRGLSRCAPLQVSSFILKEESASGEERRLGSATIDLASYATPDISSDKVELSFCDGKIVLRLNLSSHWLKSVNAHDDDNDSTASFDSDISSNHNPSSRASSVAAPAGAPGTAVPPIGLTSRQFTAMDADERALTSRRREEAIEERWAEEERRGRGAQDAEALADEVARLGDELSRSRCEGTYLRDRLARLQAENRVLRRDPRTGKREDLVLQLEVELQTKEMERADMEEELSSAFGGVIKELQARVAGLAAERDRLLAGIEETRGGWSRGFKTAR